MPRYAILNSLFFNPQRTMPRDVVKGSRSGSRSNSLYTRDKLALAVPKYRKERLG